MKCACYRCLDLLMFTRPNVYICQKYLYLMDVSWIQWPDCASVNSELMERLAVLLLSGFYFGEVGSVLLNGKK